MVAVARDLGADERVVTVVQYLRVFVVLITLPIVTGVVFHPEHGQGTLDSADAGLLRDLVLLVVSLVVGLLLARLCGSRRRRCSAPSRWRWGWP